MTPAVIALLVAQLAPVSSEIALHRVGAAEVGLRRESVLLGNGSFVARVECGTYLRVYLSHAAARSESGRRIDLGSIEIDVQSIDRSVCERVLFLDEGRLQIAYGSAPGGRTLELFVEPDRDVLHVVGTVEEGAWVTLTAFPRGRIARLIGGDDLRAASNLDDLPEGAEISESRDIFVQRLVNQLATYHRNETSIATLVEDASAPPRADPLLHLTSGTWIEGGDFYRIREDTYAAESMQAGEFHVRVAASCVVTRDAEAWIDGVASQSASSTDWRAARDRTTAWWRSHFAASRIEIAPPSGMTPDGDASVVTRAYALERFASACTARFDAIRPPRGTSPVPDRMSEFAEERGARTIGRAEAAIAAFRFPRAPENSPSGIGFVKELESMLVRTQSEAIRVLPAWPTAWDVSFRLHAPGPTVAEGTWRGGAWLHLATEPPREIVRVGPWPR